MRQEADVFEVERPRKFKDSGTEQAQKNLISKITDERESRTQKYMTVYNAIWTKLNDSTVIQKPNGEFLTYPRKSQGGAADFRDGGHK